MHKKSLIYFAALIAIAVSGYFFLQPESSQNEAGWGLGPSVDLRGLQKYVDIGDELVDLKWELFGTPEWSGGVPGPTDFVTLLVTGKARSAESAAWSEAGESPVAIPINSRRPWLNPAQGALLGSLIEKTELPMAARCGARIFQAPSGRQIVGLDCRLRDEVVWVLPLLASS